MIEVEVSEETTNRLHAILEGMGLAEEKVLKPALSRGLSAGKVTASKAVRETYHISTGDFRNNGYMKYNNVSHCQDGIIGSIEFSGGVIPLIRFKVSPNTPKQGKTPSAAVLKTSSLVPFTRKRDTFVAQMKTGHIGIFERRENVYSGGRYTTKTGKYGRNKHNQAIKELLSPSVPQMVGNEAVITTVEDRVSEVINKRINHEIERLINGYGG